MAGGQPPLPATTDEHVKGHFGESTRASGSNGACCFRLITRRESDAPNLSDGDVRRWHEHTDKFKARGRTADKAYNEAVGILKDLRALALHKQRLEEFVRRVDGIRGKYSRRSRLQLRIENAKLLEGIGVEVI